jgi:hypothetical protein
MTTSHSAIAFPGGNSNANQESIKLLSEPTRLSQAPTQDEFLEIVNDFLYHTASTTPHDSKTRTQRRALMGRHVLQLSHERVDAQNDRMLGED